MNKAWIAILLNFLLVTVAYADRVEYYSSGNMKSILLDAPDESNVVYYEFLDEDFYGSGRGRYSKIVYATKEQQIIREYWNETDQPKVLVEQSSAWDGILIRLPTGDDRQNYGELELGPSGDFNGDNLMDITILEGHEDGRIKVYVIFGKDSLPSAIDFQNFDFDGKSGFIIEGVHTQEDDHGHPLFNIFATVADLNGDNIDDLHIHTRPSSQTNIDHSGADFAIYGHKPPFAASFKVGDFNGVNGFISRDSEGHNYYVSRIVYDINNDGDKDIVFFEEGCETDCHRYYLYADEWPENLSEFGPSILNSDNGFIVKDVTAKFGPNASMYHSLMDDINGDGAPEAFVHLRGFNPFDPNEIKLFIKFSENGVLRGEFDIMETELDGDNGFVISGIQSPQNVRLMPMADSDQDGLTDFSLLITSGAGETPSGIYNIYNTGNWASNFRLSDMESDTGSRILFANNYEVNWNYDLNHDDRRDFILRPKTSQGWTDYASDAYVLYSQLEWAVSDLDDLTSTEGFVISPSINQSGQKNIFYVHTPGDFNGDGWFDFVIETRDSQEARSRIYLIYGGDPNLQHVDLGNLQLNGVNGFEITGFVKPAYLSGYSDNNGDGLIDLRINAQIGQFSNETAEHIIYGRKNFSDSSLSIQDLNGINGFVITQNAYFTSLRDDINQDGVNDSSIVFYNRFNDPEAISLPFIPFADEVNSFFSEFNISSLGNSTIKHFYQDGNIRILVRPTGDYKEYYADGSEFLLGDANRDKKVDLTDFNLIKIRFGENDESVDVNFDNQVDLKDFNLLKQNFGKATSVESISSTALDNPTHLSNLSFILSKHDNIYQPQTLNQSHPSLAPENREDACY